MSASNCFDCHELEQELKLAHLHSDIATNTIQRVRDLHRPCPCKNWHYEHCITCGPNTTETYPCFTIQALDGRP